MSRTRAAPSPGEDLRRPALASGVSDGHLQLLLLLTALFSEGSSRDSLFLFDEPEISLHPVAFGVFAEALELAVSGWNRQVFVATHSPVLISQFAPERILAVASERGSTRLTRVSEIPGIDDLLQQYAAGSLYMADVLAPQAGGVLDPTGHHAHNSGAAASIGAFPGEHAGGVLWLYCAARRRAHRGKATLTDSVGDAVNEEARTLSMWQ